MTPACASLRAADHGPALRVAEQFEEASQQRAAATLGM